MSKLNSRNSGGWRPPIDLIVCWATLMFLLGLTVVIAYQPLRKFNFPIALAIAALKAGLVAAIFMELRNRSGIIRVFACAGIAWLAILMWLGLMDFLSRT